MLKYKQLDTSSKWLFYYIVNSVVFAVGSFVLMLAFGNNMWFFNLMNFLQFVILSFFYLSSIKSPRLRYIILRAPLVMLVVFATDFVSFDSMKYFDSFATGLKCISLIFFAICLFYQQLNDKKLIEKSIYINSLPTFWYNTGLFLYFSAAFLFDLSMNLMQKSAGPNMTEPEMLVYCINFFMGSVAMILFYIGLTKTAKKEYAIN
ncbi:hypothetical protein [Chitinophaga sp. Cy-1792]|uniref:hypothetical protein n=1 Tax=Chitinophaga sp. Cy-1792 TaxID=2608339 RepID=UPI00141DD173|nr:hypothetical protein [Chitinophaga sp. Cy-1792]NIG56111.1 hypothetical protein [Chitinophaga sp. Cy-1792]